MFISADLLSSILWWGVPVTFLISSFLEWNRGKRRKLLKKRIASETVTKGPLSVHEEIENDFQLEKYEKASFMESFTFYAFFVLVLARVFVFPLFVEAPNGNPDKYLLRDGEYHKIDQRIYSRGLLGSDEYLWVKTGWNYLQGNPTSIENPSFVWDKISPAGERRFVSFKPHFSWRCVNDIQLYVDHCRAYGQSINFSVNEAFAKDLFSALYAVSIDHEAEIKALFDEKGSQATSIYSSFKDDLLKIYNQYGNFPEGIEIKVTGFDLNYF